MSARRFSTTPICLGLMLGIVAPVLGQETWLVRRDEKGAIRVEVLAPDKATPAKGLVLWNDGGAERWKVVPAGWRVPIGKDAEPAPPAASAGAVRSAVLNGSGTLEFGQLTMQLDQLRGAVVA